MPGLGQLDRPCLGKANKPMIVQQERGAIEPQCARYHERSSDESKYLKNVALSMTHRTRRRPSPCAAAQCRGRLTRLAEAEPEPLPAPRGRRPGAAAPGPCRRALRGPAGGAGPGAARGP